MGPLGVSTDAGNTALLGTDGLLFVPSATGVLEMTAAAYAALAVKDPATLYVIKG
jgi:hypothetical protein